MRINICGTPIGSSGFATHTRNLALALKKINLETSLEWGIDPQQIPPKLLPLFEKHYPEGHNIMITDPLLWNFKKVDQKQSLIGFGVFEGDKVPTAFIKPANGCDLLFVPSNHTKKAFKAQGITTPIKIIPHGVDTTLFHPEVPIPEAMIAAKSDKFTFLFNKGWAKGELDRSNLPFLLRTFCKEFSKEENVRLLVHINPSYSTTDPTWLQNEIDKLNLPKDSAETFIVNDLVPTSDLPGLYRLGDCYVNVSKAEAFSMDVLEAMACGLPVITAGFGGQTDFCNKDNAWILDKFKLVPASDPSITYEETNWAEYDEDQLRKHMREAFENDKLCKEKAKEALKTVQKYTWESVAKKVIKVLEGLE